MLSPYLQQNHLVSLFLPLEEEISGRSSVCCRTGITLFYQHYPLHIPDRNQPILCQLHSAMQEILSHWSELLFPHNLPEYLHFLCHLWSKYTNHLISLSFQTQRNDLSHYHIKTGFPHPAYPSNKSSSDRFRYAQGLYVGFPHMWAGSSHILPGSALLEYRLQ